MLEHFCKSMKTQWDLMSHHQEAARYLERGMATLGGFPKIKKK